jgi:polysaccharide lyase-like protein
LVRFTSHYAQMPLITNANKRQTYSTRLRYGTMIHNSGVNFSLYQDGPATGGYGTQDGKGPVVQGWRQASDGHFRFTVSYASGSKYDTYDVGYIALGTWHTYTVNVVWSDNASEGRFEFYVDGTRKKTVTGRGTNLSPDSNRLPMFRLGLYGDYATGTIDVDNVLVKPWLSSGASPSVALSTPTNVHLVGGE